MTEPAGPYRDGKVHVLEEQCSTCVLRPGNLMQLSAGRMKELLDDNLAEDAALQCHQTLPYSEEARPPAVCRGFFDHPRSNESASLRLARLMNVLEFDQ